MRRSSYRPSAYVQRVIAANPFAELVGETVKLKKTGSRLYGECPDCGSASFSIDGERGLYYCHGCRSGGNVFSWVMARRGIGFKEALAWLAERGGQPGPGQGRYSKPVSDKGL